jgi:putative ABC transport system permease protein
LPREVRRERGSLPIRAAVGASRGQIIRQLLIESLAIAVLGGGLGFVFALWSREALVALGSSGGRTLSESGL